MKCRVEEKPTSKWHRTILKLMDDLPTTAPQSNMIEIVKIPLERELQAGIAQLEAVVIFNFFDNFFSVRES